MIGPSTSIATNASGGRGMRRARKSPRRIHR